MEARAIRFGTRWWPSHVEFINVGDEPGGDGSAVTLGARTSGGVRFRPPTYCKPTREEWWTAPGIEAAYDVAKGVVGAPYDWIDILGFVFARDWHRPGHYICSGLVDASFKKAGHPMTNEWMPIHRVSPRDLLASPLLTFIKRVI